METIRNSLNEFGGKLRDVFGLKEQSKSQGVGIVLLLIGILVLHDLVGLVLALLGFVLVIHQGDRS